jgi:hypothetical protein
MMAAVLTRLHMQTAANLFGGPPGIPRTEIAASVQWAERIMEKIDKVFGLKFPATLAAIADAIRGTGKCGRWLRNPHSRTKV